MRRAIGLMLALAAAGSAHAAADPRALAGHIMAQVKPCYMPPAGDGQGSHIVTQLLVTMQRDGSVSSVTVGAQTGVNDTNRTYAVQLAAAAVRAVQRCSPLSLPAELYEGGWDHFEFRFSPDQMP